MVVSPQPGPVVVRAEGVSKLFTVRKDNTLKERIVHAGRRGRTHKQEYVAVDGVDLEIRAGTTVGLLGPNGSGKSTLLKLIGGIVSPTRGCVLPRGRMGERVDLRDGSHPQHSGPPHTPPHIDPHLPAPPRARPRPSHFAALCPAELTLDGAKQGPN